MYAAGIDAGTSGVKCTIFDESLSAVAYAYREYATLSPAPGMFEIDPESVLRGAKEVIS